MTLNRKISAPLVSISYPKLVVNNVNNKAGQGGLGRRMAHSDEDVVSSGDLVLCLQAVGLSGDRKAFRVLFDYFAPRVKAYVIRLGCSHQQAEELAQETMVKVWNKADQFDATKAAPSTWIFRIARNLRIDAFRRENHPEFDQTDPSLQPAEESPADLVIEQMQSKRQLQEAMAVLSEEQMSLLQLSFFRDMSHNAIADHLGIPLGTVKSRLRLAMKKLRTILVDKDQVIGNGRNG